MSFAAEYDPVEAVVGGIGKFGARSLRRTGVTAAVQRLCKRNGG